MKILFVYQELATFVGKDLDILKSAHTVKEARFQGIKDIPQLWAGTKWCDVTFSWFGKLHAFFSVLFSVVLGRKSIVVAGGDDATKYIVGGKRYGLFAHPLKKLFARFIFKHADLILTVSEFTQRELFTHLKIASGKTKLLYHGFDSRVFKMAADVKKGNLVVTVGDINRENYCRKGHKFIVETAALLPGLQFEIIGPWLDNTILRLKKIAPSNVRFTGGLYGAALIRALSRASVYLQISEWESFCCALAEAMLCECAPVVSDTTALPEVAGDCALYIRKFDADDLAQKINMALKLQPESGKKARERISRVFPIEKRRNDLLSAVEELSGC